MNWAWQHWVALVVVIAVAFYVGRKTTFGSQIPVIGS